MFAILLTVLGIGSRLASHTPQFTAILAVAMFAGMYLNPRLAMIVPLVTMAITDVILGFHDTMFYTWGSMLLISGIGIWLKSHKNFISVLGGSLVSAIVFFIVTNFGAWLTLYPHTAAGLRECYILAIPFFRSTVVSTVAYSLVLYAVYEWLYARSQGTALARLF